MQEMNRTEISLIIVDHNYPLFDARNVLFVFTLKAATFGVTRKSVKNHQKGVVQINQKNLS